MRVESFALLAAMAVTSAPAAAQVADRVGQNRDRGGVVVVTPPPGTRGRAGGVVVTPDRNRRDDCRDGVWNDRSRPHGWDDRDGRYDCDVRYDRDRRGYGVRVRSALLREHAALNVQLDREHDRWHRSHGWFPRNRGWERSHEALHRRLEREHDRWHERNRVPMTLPGDRYRFDDVPGRGRGFVVIR